MKHASNRSLKTENIAPANVPSSCQCQASHDTFRGPVILLDAIDDPGDCIAQCFSTHGPTGLPDGRQTFQRPNTRTALPQLTHEKTVRKEDQVHVAGLPQAVPELTVTHTQVLLAVPVKALGASPAASICTEDTTDLPVRPVTHQHLAGLLTVSSLP